jgi:hypothetical protein
MGRSDPASHACGPELTAAPSRQAGTELTGRLAWRLLTFRDVTFVQRRFLSLEPLLGPLPSLDLAGIDWVICGGESGPGHRPADPAWVRELRDRCLTVGVAFFFKQWGGPTPHRRRPAAGRAHLGPLPPTVGGRRHRPPAGCHVTAPGVRSGMWSTATVRARRVGALGDAVVAHQAAPAIAALWRRLQGASW